MIYLLKEGEGREILKREQNRETAVSFFLDPE